MSDRKFLYKDVARDIQKAQRMADSGRLEEAREKYVGNVYRASAEECEGQDYAEREVEMVSIDDRANVSLMERYRPREPAGFIHFKLEQKI